MRVCKERKERKHAIDNIAKEVLLTFVIIILIIVAVCFLEEYGDKKIDAKYANVIGGY